MIQNEHLVAYEKPAWDQTTKYLLDEGDLTVFMEEGQYQFCKDNFGFNSKTIKFGEFMM